MALKQRTRRGWTVWLVWAAIGAVGLSVGSAAPQKKLPVGSSAPAETICPLCKHKILSSISMAAVSDDGDGSDETIVMTGDVPVHILVANPDEVGVNNGFALTIVLEDPAPAAGQLVELTPYYTGSTILRDPPKWVFVQPHNSSATTNFMPDYSATGTVIINAKSVKLDGSSTGDSGKQVQVTIG